MSFQNNPQKIEWRLHLNAPPTAVFEVIATDEGRARFWAESATEVNGMVHFKFPNGQQWRGRIREKTPPRRFSIHYFGDSVTTFELADDGRGGTDLLLQDVGVPAQHRAEVIAGWVSVLLALKAAVDFGVDLRNHDPQRTWDQGYVEN